MRRAGVTAAALVAMALAENSPPVASKKPPRLRRNKARGTFVLAGFRNPKRDVRRSFGWLSGRQWVKLRKRLQRAQR